MQRPPRYDPRYLYRLRMLACTALSLLLVLLTLHYGPAASSGEGPDLVYSTQGREVIQLEEIQPTMQRQRTPPPPKPFLPIVVPNETELEDVELDLSDNVLPLQDPSDEPGGDLQIAEGTAGRTAPYVEEGPKPVRFVEPEYTHDAQRKHIRAAVRVEVLIDRQGRVQEARILERFLLNDQDQPAERLEQLGYGLEQAALAAAQRWLFRPARQNGQAVASTTTLTFSFGVKSDNS